VIGDVAAAAGLVDLDAARGERLRRGENVRAATVAADAERQHMGMFEQQQHLVDAAGPSLLDERALQRERVSVRDALQPAHIEHPRCLLHLTCLSHLTHPTHMPYLTTSPTRRRQTALGSQFSSDVFTIDMNSSATAPSMTRWS